MKKIAPILLALVLFSCSKKEAAYTETIKEFPENRWNIEDMKTFMPELKEEVKDAMVYLHFSYVYEPGYDAVPVAVIWQGEDGKAENMLVEVKLKDDKGRDMGDCAGDVCDIAVPVKEHVNLAKGKYKIGLMHKFDGEYLPNVLAVGLSIEKGE